MGLRSSETRHLSVPAILSILYIHVKFPLFQSGFSPTKGDGSRFSNGTKAAEESRLQSV